jgi:hypothetical protein
MRRVRRRWLCSLASRANWLTRARYGVAAVLVLGACSATQVQEDPSQVPALGPPAQYSYSDFEGREVSSRSLSGRATLVALITTYDWASQLVLRRVNQTLGSFAPRINAVGIVLEPASYAVLVPPFHKSLELKFPLVMGDVGSLNGAGPFGPIEYVPTVVVLDRDGRERRRFKGPVTVEELTKALRLLQPSAQ